MVSSVHGKKIYVIQTVVSGALAKGFPNPAFCSTMEATVQKCAPETPCVDADVVKLVDASFFTVPEAKFERHKD